MEQIISYKGKNRRAWLEDHIDRVGNQYTTAIVTIGSHEVLLKYAGKDRFGTILWVKCS